MHSGSSPISNKPTSRTGRTIASSSDNININFGFNIANIIVSSAVYTERTVLVANKYTN